MRNPSAPVFLTLLLAVFGSAVSSADGGKTAALEKLAPLPVPISNNAVSLLAGDDGVHLFSILGLESGKKWSDASSRSFQWSLQAPGWKELQPVPGPGGRLAASAVTVAGNVYVFGGYTVAGDGSEKSTAGVYRLDRPSGQWRWYSDMPVAVEDSVVLVYQDRFVYLVSGWHDLGNVNLVQVLDTSNGEWDQATPYPGDPVFGHSGGMDGDRFIVCDGVKIVYASGASARQFVPSEQCWRGQVSESDHRRITWHPVNPHPGGARYRMAAGGDRQGRVYFAGGAVNPYNFDGMGYNHEPAQPESALFSYNFNESAWECHGNLPVATMDHRGLPSHEGWFYVIGGMRENQRVTDQVFRFRPAPGRKCP